MPDNTHHINEINRLRFEVQEQQARYKELFAIAKGLMDAVSEYKKASKDSELKKKWMVIMQTREKQLKEKVYPKKMNQSTFDWLAK